MPEYMGTKEAARQWQVSQGTISRWCRERKIEGAEQDAKGSPWRIPKDAKILANKGGSINGRKNHH